MTARPDRAVDQHALFDALTEYRTKVQSYADAFAEVLPVLRCGGSPDADFIEGNLRTSNEVVADLTALLGIHAPAGLMSTTTD